MAGGLLLVKLVATPTIIAGVSWVERRFGPAVAGLVAGLPLTSGPVSVFLALEQGPDFSRGAAVGMLAGIAAVGAFLLAFAFAAVRGPWWAAVAAGSAAYAPVAWALGATGLGLFWTGAVAVAALAVVVLAMHKTPAAEAARRPHAWWEVPLRMALSTALVLSLTAAAGGLGPHATGLLSPFPIFAAVLGAFVLQRGGPGAALLLQRGIALGAFSFVAFFLVVGATLGTMPLPASYLLAYAAAVGTTMATYRLAMSRRRPHNL